MDVELSHLIGTEASIKKEVESRPRPIPNSVFPDNQESKPNGHCQVDLTENFHHIFAKKSFNSFKEFDELFTKFKKETGSVFRIKSSCSISYENSRRKQHFIPPRFKFVSIKYCCVHYGKPKTSGQGIRTKQRYLPCGCQSFLSVAYNRGALVISQVNMQHNHEVSNKLAPYYAINRRISTEELKQVADVIDVIPSSRALQNFLKKKFQRPMTLQDAKNTRQRLKNMQIKEGHIESIEVVPSFKGISQVYSEGHSRAVLEIKEEEEEEEMVESEICDEDCHQTKLSSELCQEKENETNNKVKALSEVLTKFSGFMNSCSTDIFWKRIATMNELMKCWENGTSFKMDTIGLSTESVNVDLSLDGQNNKTDLQQTKLELSKDEKLKPSCDSSSQTVDKCKKSNSSCFDARNLKVGSTSDEGKRHLAMHRKSGRRKKSCENYLEKTNCKYVRHQSVLESSYVHDTHGNDATTVCETVCNSNNENNIFNSYYGLPLISCITKEPCLDLNEQAIEVEIEINDNGGTNFKTKPETTELL